VAAAPIPVHVHAEDAGFADEEDDHSDPEMGAADEEDEPVEEADDLQGLGADAVERRLADSVKFQMMRATLLTAASSGTAVVVEQHQRRGFPDVLQAVKGKFRLRFRLRS
jgi:hypothetical protein